MARRVMRLLDPFTGLMECKVCGTRHAALPGPGKTGRYARGSWQCVNGCQLTPLVIDQNRDLRPHKQ
jgi:hypothetical protein